MSQDTPIRNLLLKQLESISLSYGYDFLYDDEGEVLLCQIVYRDNNGTIVATPLSFHLQISEEKGTGEAIFYHSRGEFKRQKFDIYEEDSLLNILVFVQERLNQNNSNNAESI